MLIRLYLLGLQGHSVPDGIQLAPHKVVKALEEALLQRHAAGVHLFSSSCSAVRGNAQNVED